MYPNTSDIWIRFAVPLREIPKPHDGHIVRLVEGDSALDWPPYTLALLLNFEGYQAAEARNRERT